MDDTTAASDAKLPLEPAQERTPDPSRQLAEGQTLFRFRAATVALPIGVAVFSFAGLKHGDSSSSVLAGFATVACAVLLGLAYWLGRTRPAPGTAQRLNMLGKFISVIPILGVTRIPLMAGLYRATKRRLVCRNIAILAGIWTVGAAFDAADTAAADIAALLAVLAVGLAVLLVRRLPAAYVSPTTPKAPTAPTVPTVPTVPAAPTAPTVPAAPGDEQARAARDAPDAHVDEDATTAAVTHELPAPTRVADLAPAAAAARRLYWLVGSVKFGVIFFALGILAPNNKLDATWASGIVVWIGAVAVLGVAVAIQEARVRPWRGVLLSGLLVCLVCLGGVVFGAMTGSDAGTGIIGWATWPVIFYQPYRRQRKRAGLTDDTIQAASRVGHLPTRSGRRGRRRSVTRPAAWLRGIAGAICAVPIVLLGLFNSLVGAPLLSDLIGAVLDKLFGLARGSADALLASLDPDESPVIALASSTEPEAWRLIVRGDLFHFGKLGRQRVAFEEFLRTRLEVYGEVRGVTELPAETARLVAMPVCVPLDREISSAACLLARQLPLLILVSPIGSRHLQNWPVLAQQFHSAGIDLPELAYPDATVAVLHLPASDNVVYLARSRDQWSYFTAIYEALAAVAAATVAQATTRPDPGTKEPKTLAER